MYLEVKKSSFFFCQQKNKNVNKHQNNDVCGTFLKKLIIYWRPKELNMLCYLTFFLGMYSKVFNDLKEFKKSLPRDRGDVAE